MTPSQSSSSPKTSRVATTTRGLALGLVVLCLGAAPAAEASPMPSSVEAKFRPVSSIRDDLDFDENGKLSSHYLVFPANRPDCPTHRWEERAFTNGEGKMLKGSEAGDRFMAHPLEGDALERVFPHYGTGKSYLGRDRDSEIDLASTGGEDTRCLAACLEMGTDIAYAGHTMPHYHYSSTDKSIQGGFDSWFHKSCKQVEVCFLNYATKHPLLVNWIASDGRRQKQFDLEYSDRKTRCFNSFVGHTFEAIDEATGFHETVTIGHITTKAFGESPPSSSQRFDDVDQVEQKVRDALDEEWRKHSMVPRTFSSLGFAKGRLPDDVFANMAAFYYNNRDNVVNEEWEGKGVFVNWWETNVKFVQIPWQNKHKWQLRLMEMVSQWAGVEVEETSMYGLRQYDTGARLLSHVDRLPTHAVSLIVNVAQENLANPWPVEVFDHADRLHEVDMDAGDIVYYESAKNLHSRNRPLTCKKGGCRFINLFTHYRPVADGGGWYKNLNDMPNRPPPLADGRVAYDTDESRCVFNNETEFGASGVSGENVLGIGTVQCDDRRLGRYLSPTKFRLRDADDLFRWWKSTENAHLIGFDENKEPIYHPNKDAMAEEYEKPPTHNPQVAAAGEDLAFDVHEECLGWAERGDCEKRPVYMKENCAKSCEVRAAVRRLQAAAGVGDEETQEEEGNNEEEEVVLVDTHGKCEEWTKMGECDKNQVYMGENCAKSCRAFRNAAANQQHEEEEAEDTPAQKEEEEEVVVVLEDTQESCKMWADRGECEANPVFMNKRCAKSCRERAANPRAREEEEVHDVNEKCEFWAGLGECEKNPRYMLIHCKKSCRGVRVDANGTVITDTNSSDGYCANNNEDGLCSAS